VYSDGDNGIVCVFMLVVVWCQLEAAEQKHKRRIKKKLTFSSFFIAKVWTQSTFVVSKVWTLEIFVVSWLLIILFICSFCSARMLEKLDNANYHSFVVGGEERWRKIDMSFFFAVSISGLFRTRTLRVFCFPGMLRGLLSII
jgi:hypothetical protein